MSKEVAAGRTERFTETFTVTARRGGAAGALVLEWEHTRVEIPVRGL